MPRIKEIIQAATLELSALGFNIPRLDVEILLSYSLNIDKNELFMNYERDVSDSAFKILLERRKKFEPIAYILSHKEFWGLDFKVTNATLIPRPDSESIIEFAFSSYLDINAPYKILDLGTGTGCLGLSLLKEYKNAHATLLDISKDALNVAAFNSENLGFQNRVKLIHSAWFENLALQKFDIIVCNPPYIDPDATLAPDVSQYEPHSALFASNQGYGEYRKISEHLHRYLGSNSTAFFECGKNQDEKIIEIFLSSNYMITGIEKDIAGINRVIGVGIGVKGGINIGL